ncbi:unnamed protein product [Caenorhabditis angaria]|uniref:glucuronosyltransferase n=1 Tax=Caenorhabditis angaria TaxID=860376 RepID=A0A9P1IXI6_9PELO|nr:unnamed protein product [Caenorhabditis angaria]
MFFIYFLLVSYVQSYNILISNPVIGYSHMKFMGKLADLLASQGHTITVLECEIFPTANIESLIKNKSIERIFYPKDVIEVSESPKEDPFLRLWDDPMFTDPLFGSLVMPSIFSELAYPPVKKLLNDKDLLNNLRNRKFDAIIAETFEISGFYVAHLLGIKSIISVMTSVRYPAVQYLFGQPNILGYVPGAFSKYGKNARFFDRLNDWYFEFFETRKYFQLCEKQYELINEDGKLPHWTKLVTKSTFYIVNSNPYLDFALPSTPNIVYVGGMTINKNKTIGSLPEEYSKILNEREATVIVSFGTVVKSFEMPSNFKKGLLKTFKSLPNITFIWKYEKDDDIRKDLPNNVYLKKWIPQPELLADKRVKLFVTHGGLGSTFEVAYSGIPTIVIPLFNDQFNNAMIKMVENERYSIKAQELANVLLNQPYDPKETLLKHIDFAIKFPTFDKLTPEVGSSNFIGFYYLDVFGFLLVIGIDFPMFKQSLSTSYDSEVNDELPSITSPNSSTSKPGPSTTHRHQRPTQCLVCGKPANGFHYEVESCNGCKTFFRRVIMSEKQFKCKLEGDCFDLMKRENPVKCRACRYEKCISVGMNPLAMQVDEEEAKSGKFVKLTKKRENAIKEEVIDLEYETTSDCLRVMTTQRNINEQIIDSLVYLEMKVEEFRYSAYNPESTKIPCLKNLLTSKTLISLANKMGPMKWSTEPIPKPPPPPPPNKEGGLRPRPPFDPTRKQWFPFDLLAMVEYSKTFMYLNQLDLEDRIRLVQHGTLACMNLHISFHSVSRKYDELIFPDGDAAFMKIGSVYGEAVMSMQPLIRYNVGKTEYILLKAILLCNPAVSDLSEHAQKIIMKQRKEYANALFDYCLSQPNLGPSHFVLLIGIIDTLEHQQRHQKDLHVLYTLPHVKKLKISERMLLVDDIMEN